MRAVLIAGRARGGRGLSSKDAALGMRGTIVVVAALLGAALTATLWSYWRRDSVDANVPIVDYATLFRDPRGLPMGLTLMPSPAGSRWTMSDRARAIRLGARLADLEIVIRGRTRAADASYYQHDPVADWVVANNSALIARFAGDLAAGFDNVSNETSAAAWYRTVQRSGQDGATVSWEVLEFARQWGNTFKPGYLALAEWLELGRAAALREDSKFFERAESRALVAAALEMQDLPPDARVPFAQVRDITPGTSVGDFSSLEHALTNALSALAK